MKMELTRALAELEEQIKAPNFVRAVLSGRRRNLTPTAERIDIKPVLLKGEEKLQVQSTDGRQVTTKNLSPNEIDFAQLLGQGFANLLAESTSESYSVRISKKDEALVTIGRVKLERDLTHDRQKQRLLPEDNRIFALLGMHDGNKRIKPSKMDKYRQVEEFLRLLKPTLETEVGAQPEISIVDLGCGHAYLTFAVQEYLNSATQKVKVLGVDEREESKRHNDQIANSLRADAQFLVSKIADTPTQSVDIAIALHACDTATDDSIAWAVKNSAKVIMLAPCCHHDLQAQIDLVPEPWSLLTRHGVVSERLIDLMTDSLRAQILKLLGYRVDIVEFIGGEHTPRNIMIRAVKTGVKVDPVEVDRYQAMLADWKIAPHLAELLKSELSARI
ncbi:MAG: SAM-dependent methyltransferase [Candidatus Nanopelagicaceae bacterium]|nr:SAM-dependent methyltransferase [Candidatus Nanopelagicaceae bacterium]